MYDNEFEIKENEITSKDKIQPQNGWIESLN